MRNLNNKGVGGIIALVVLVIAVVLMLSAKLATIPGLLIAALAVAILL